MSLTLLEKQGTIHYPKSGALLNYHALGKQSGSLYGCDLILSNSERVVLTTGVLVIRGYRIDVVDEVIFDSSNFVSPADATKYYIIIQVDAGDEDTEIERFVLDSPPSNTTPIEQSSGLYDYLVGEFMFGPLGITNLKTMIKKIDTTKSVGGTISGANWYDGTDVDGIEEPIYCGLEEVPNVQIGDYYLNNINGNYFKCFSITNDFVLWEWKGNLKGAEGPQGPAGNVDLSNYYNKTEIDNLLASLIVGSSDELSLIEGSLIMERIVSSSLTLIDSTLTIE